MTEPQVKRLLARGWAYVPAVSGPIGGGLIKLGRGSTEAAVAVGLAPYAIWGLLLTAFVIGYIATLLRYLCCKPEERDDAERFITVSANAIVSILTLTATTIPAPTKRAQTSCRGGCGGDGHARATATAQSAAGDLSLNGIRQTAPAAASSGERL